VTGAAAYDSPTVSIGTASDGAMVGILAFGGS